MRFPQPVVVHHRHPRFLLVSYARDYRLLDQQSGETLRISWLPENSCLSRNRFLAALRQRLEGLAGRTPAFAGGGRHTGYKVDPKTYWIPDDASDAVRILTSLYNGRRNEAVKALSEPSLFQDLPRMPSSRRHGRQ